MVRVQGVESKIKITPSIHSSKLVFLKLYGHKIVQSFCLEVSNYTLANMFWFEALSLFTNECLD